MALQFLPEHLQRLEALGAAMNTFQSNANDRVGSLEAAKLDADQKLMHL